MTKTDFEPRTSSEVSEATALPTEPQPLPQPSCLLVSNPVKQETCTMILPLQIK